VKSAKTNDPCELKVSIVIPVYNEADYLDACLRSIAAQTVKPHEVIVVDNNSIDDSVLVARRYDFVRLVYEKKQGVTYARTRGYDIATGDIIGRIDAEAILRPNWVQMVQCIFAESDVAAISGKVEYFDFPLKQLVDKSDLFFRRRIAANMARYDRVFLQAVNMAMRRDAWQDVRHDLCYKFGIHEDFDLAIHLQERGWRVTFDPRIVATGSARRIDMNFIDFLYYAARNPKSYSIHGLPYGRYMYPAIVTVILCYLPGRLLYKGFNTETRRFSLTKLFGNYRSETRVDPTIIET
jgi:glycosyltransferase involved in cell wall biosynthesis